MKKKLVIAWIILGLCLIGTVLFTIETSATGAKLSLLEEEEERLAAENRSLSAKLVEFSSLVSLEKRAGESEFKKPTSIIYLTGADAVAKLP